MLPLLAFLAFVWFERRYLQIIYYDFTSQLEPQHRVYNLLWCACPASCGPRAPHTSRPADLAPCRPRLLLSALLGWRRHLTSPSMPLAVWAYFYNPRIFTDLPRWPGMLAVVPTMLISNGLLLYYFHRNTQEYIGSVRRWVTAPAAAACPLPVRPLEANMRALTAPLAEYTAHTRCACAAQVRWLHGVWLVWRKPRDLAARGKMP